MSLFFEQFLVIDYGSTNIKGILYQSGPGGKNVLRVESLPIVNIKPEENQSGEILGEYEYNVIRFIQSFFPEEQNFILNIPMDRVYVRDVNVPITNLKVIQEVIPSEVENLVPVSLDEAEVIGNAWDIGEENSSVITFTARHDTLESMVIPLMRGTASVKMLSLDSVGLAGILTLLDVSEYRDRVIGQIDIGGEYTIFNVLKDGKLVYSRLIPFAGNSITHAVADTLGIDVKLAEQKKIDLEIDVSEDGRKAEKSEQFYKRNRIEKKDYAKVIKAVRGVFEDIASDIERSVLSLPCTSPEFYFLSGGASLHPGAGEFLEKNIEARMRPYPLDMGKSEDIAIWATAIGTGEHYRLKESQRLDFLSGPFGSTLRRSEFNFNYLATPILFLAGSIIILLVSFLISILLDQQQIKGYRRQIVEIAKNIPGMGASEDPIAEAKKICLARLQSVQGQTGGVTVLEILRDLTDRTPPPSDLKFELKRFNYIDREVQLEAELDNVAQVGPLQEKYQASPYYSKIEITSRNLLPNQKVRLTMKLTLKQNNTSLGADCR